MNLPLNELKTLKVIGNSTTIPINHPVIELVLQRWVNGSLPGHRAALDNNRVALCIEGGGMRGCVAAGATAALNVLGLNDAVDIVYGSSAGSMIGAYFISRQYTGIEIYHGKYITH